MSAWKGEWKEGNTEDTQKAKTHNATRTRNGRTKHSQCYRILIKRKLINQEYSNWPLKGTKVHTLTQTHGKNEGKPWESGQIESKIVTHTARMTKNTYKETRMREDAELQRYTAVIRIVESWIIVVERENGSLLTDCGRCSHSCWCMSIFSPKL